jgi:spore germination protein YaaH
MSRAQAIHPFPLAISNHAGIRILAVWIALFIVALPLRGREPRLLSQFYLVNDPASVQSLEKNYSKISLVCPQWFSVDEAGNLESAADSSVVDWAARKGVLLMPLLVNQRFQAKVAHSVLSDDSVVARVIQQIIRVGDANHFFGIQFDFENIPPEDRELYSKFIGMAAKEFRKHHLKLSIAVVPPFSPPAPASPLAPPPSAGWIPNPHASAYDYERLASNAFFISLMTYDEYASPEQPGPVAGGPWVEACLRETLKSISRKKLLLGLPLYYREWSGKSVHEGSNQEAQDLATKWNAKINLDADQREAYFSFNDGQQEHFVWTQDAQTLRERIEMVKQYGLAGFSAWRLGFEDSQAWETIFPEVIRNIH